MSQTQAVSAAAAGTITLGGDLTVNRLGYGAMRITGKGIWGPPDDKPAALATLRRAVELGVNFIDTADSYGPNVSEELIAEALYPYPAGLVITTKGGWERSGPAQWLHNASPQHLTEAVEGSLRACVSSASMSTSCTFPIRLSPTMPPWKHWLSCASRVRFATSPSPT
jgi:pyridoxine 4-dehydrogenase